MEKRVDSGVNGRKVRLGIYAGSLGREREAWIVFDSMGMTMPRSLP